jgi:hypothetical protein
VTTLGRWKTDAADDRRRVAVEDGGREASRGHAEIEGGRAGVATTTSDSQGQRRSIKFKANGAHHPKENPLPFVVGVVGSLALLLEVLISCFILPALGIF